MRRSSPRGTKPEAVEQGYPADKPTFLVLGGSLPIPDEPGVRATFEWIAKARLGTRTYVGRDSLDGRNLYEWESGHRGTVRGKLWVFPMAPEIGPSFLNSYALRIIEDVGYDELAAGYIGPTGRRLAPTPERAVCAERV